MGQLQVKREQGCNVPSTSSKRFVRVDSASGTGPLVSGASEALAEATALGIVHPAFESSAASIASASASFGPSAVTG